MAVNQVKYILDENDNRVEVIVPYSMFRKFENIISEVEKSEVSALVKAVTWEESGFEQISAKYNNVPNINIDDTIREDRDRL